MDKLAINWQNFAQVRLQLKFAFNIRPLLNFTPIFGKNQVFWAKTVITKGFYFKAELGASPLALSKYDKSVPEL